MAKANAGVLYMDSRADRGRSRGRQSRVAADARHRSVDRARERAPDRRGTGQAAYRRRTRRGAPHPAESDAAPSARRKAGSWSADRAEPSHQVGGDYFDVVAIGPDTWSLVVADVSGKGVSSALLASFLQGAFLSASATTRYSRGAFPHQHFSERPLRTRQIRDDVLFEARFGRAPDLRQRRPLRATAGADDGLDRKAGSDFDAGRPGAGASFPLDHRDLAPGDRIVLYTDGVTEAQNDAGDFFGRRRLREAVQRAGGASCAGTARGDSEGDPAISPPARNRRTT